MFDLDFEKWSPKQLATSFAAAVVWFVFGIAMGRWSIGTPKPSGPLMGTKNPYADTPQAPPMSMPSPYPIQRPNFKGVYGTAEMGRDGLTILRLRPMDGGQANWDARLFGSQEPVMGGAAPNLEAPEPPEN